jgi:aspartyl-tRNA(Asn)/glutamyl-tRNA(Gln) amidotransferase subunit A
MTIANPHQLTVSQAAAAIRAGELKATGLLEALLARSEVLEPTLGLWATLDVDYAMAQARDRDKTMAAGGPVGVLHGVPAGIKDIYDTAGLLTTHGSPIFADNVPEFDAASIANLKAAGAVIMGKTVTTEFACGDPPATLNPWNAGHTPGGSSTGSAVGVAARVFPMAMGSQTAGSVLRPAAYNGVVGMKPTMGRVSRRGVIPVSWSVDTLGTFTRSVEDAALMLSALSGHDPADPFSANVASLEPGIDPNALERAPKIGVLRTFFLERCDADTLTHVEGVAARLAGTGATVEDVIVNFDMDVLQAAHRTVMNVNAAAVHERTFAERPHDYSRDVRRTIQIGLLTPSVTYVQAERIRRAFRDKLIEAMSPFDVVLTSTTREHGAPSTRTTGDPRWQAPITTSGLPSISLPSGMTPDGLPLGVQLVGMPMDERRLFGVASWVETVIGFDGEPPLDPSP